MLLSIRGRKIDKIRSFQYRHYPGHRLLTGKVNKGGASKAIVDIRKMVLDLPCQSLEATYKSSLPDLTVTKNDHEGRRQTQPLFLTTNLDNTVVLDHTK